MSSKILIKNFIFLIYAVLITSSAFLFCGNPPLRVGMELSYPPFETIDKQGQPSGISVDIANALGSDLKQRIIIDNIPFIGLIPALKTKKIDLIISSMSITPQRKESIDFSIPYLETGLALLVNKSSAIQNIEEVNKEGIVVAVKQGTSGEVYARKNIDKAKVIVLDKESSAVLEVVQGKADAFIYDQISVYTNWQKNLETTKAILTPFSKEYWAIGIRKGDSELLSKVNAFLVKFREEKRFEALGDKYLKEQKEAFRKMGIPFYL